MFFDKHNLANKKFLNWLDEFYNNKEEFDDKFMRQSLKNVKDFLLKCENNGIKTLIFSGLGPEFISRIKEDPWLTDRLITFDYKDKTYNSIFDMMEENIELQIEFDNKHFDVGPTDRHPSLDCHKLIANTIIKRIEKDI